MPENAKLKYIFLGNLINKKDLGEYPPRSSDHVFNFVI